MRNSHFVIRYTYVFLSLILAALIAATVIFFTACGDSGDNKIEYVYNMSGSGDALKIDKSDITTTAKFYGVYTPDNTYMEIIAVMYNGQYRTAFNTCQVCFYSPLGYFKQSGNYLVCQNCKNKYSMAQVGVTLGGCAPYPIYETDRTDTDDYLVIPDSFLISCEKIFANWTGGH